MSNKIEEKTMFLYVGAYENEQNAVEDFEALKELYKEGWVGNYDAGIVVKGEDSKLKVKRHTDSTGKGTRRGLAIGVVLGIVFPPSVLVSGLVGATAGNVIGRHLNDISKTELKEIGEYLEVNETALVIIGELKVEEMVNKSIKKAVKQYKKEFNADVKEYNKALDQAVKQL